MCHGGKISGDFIVFCSGLPVRGTNILDSLPDALPNMQERHRLMPTGLADLSQLENDRRAFEELKGSLGALESVIKEFEQGPKAWDSFRARITYEPVVDVSLFPATKAPGKDAPGARRGPWGRGATGELTLLRSACASGVRIRSARSLAQTEGGPRLRGSSLRR